MFKRGGKPAEHDRDERDLTARTGGWRGWFNFLLLFAVLEIVVLSLERSHWITPQPSLTLILIITMLSVRLLTISRLPGLVMHLLVLVLGAAVVFWQVFGIMPYGTFYFAVLLALITWFTGYLATWFLVRKNNAWVGVIMGTLVILVNLSNLPGGYYWYFGLFFITSVFFIFWTRLSRGHSSSRPAAGHPGRGLLYLASALLIVIILAGSIAWATPAVRIPEFQTMIATKLDWKNDFENSRFNIFANVPSKQLLNTNSMRLTLHFEASWHQSDRIDFIVNAPLPSYWQVRAYDVYTTQGWENSPVANSDLKTNNPWNDTIPPSRSEPVTYTVTPEIMTDVLLTTGSFIATSKPVQVQVSAGDIIGVLSAHVLSAGERYTVTAAVARATPKELVGAGDDYPPYILENYLQLPLDFPESVRQLSANITANTTTPYEKVLKINEYLSRIPYKTDIKARPEGIDGVAYFLFTQKAGFCVHFASAMAVMLRSVGVPTRLAIGYLPGEPGSEEGEYILRDKMYHAWPQVYFPEYGWIDIEATPSGSESAGSQVTLTEPLISSDVIQDQPQWDIWLRYYGLWPAPDAGSSAVVPPVTPRPSIPGPWIFADQLGKALLVIMIIVVSLAFLVVIIISIKSSFNRWVWRVDRSDLAVETYKKICQMAAMVKIGPKPQQTPLEYSIVLASEFPEQAGEIREITRAYLERQFGGREGKQDLFNEARLLKFRRTLFDKLMDRLSQVDKIFRGRV